MTSRAAPNVRYPKTRSAPKSKIPWTYVLVALAIGAVAVAWVLLGRESGGQGAPTRATAGQTAPSFSERDVISDKVVSSDSLRGRKVLLFFSEGVMCAPCFDQIRDLERERAELGRRGLTLVSITQDERGILQSAAFHHGLTTPLIADDDRDMSRAYDVLGVQGAMHSDRAGHTFILVDESGQIRWRRDYFDMYVRPDELFAEIPTI